MEWTGPMLVWEDNAVVENKIIYANPTSEFDRSNDRALLIIGDNVTIRNVIVYHPANG